MRSNPTHTTLLFACLLGGCGGGASSSDTTQSTASITPSDGGPTVSIAAAAASEAASDAASSPAAGEQAASAAETVVAGSTSARPKALATAGGAKSVVGDAPTSVSTSGGAVGGVEVLAKASAGATQSSTTTVTSTAIPAAQAISAAGTGGAPQPTAAVVALGDWKAAAVVARGTALSVASPIPAATTPAALTAADVIARVTLGSASPARAIGLQCQGSNSDLSAQTTVYAPIAGSSAPAQRFGTATVGTETVYRMEVGNTDQLAAGAPPRCENLVFPTATYGINQGELFWHASEIWADDWTGTSDDQLILQWHQNDPRLSLNPMLAVLLRGSQMRMEMLTSPVNPATRASYVAASAALTGWKPRQWNTIVIQGRISPLPSQAPLLRVWLNGQLVVDRNQPLGFQLQAGSYNYVKWGIYKWTNGNPWDVRYGKRSVMVRNMLLVRDPKAVYTNSVITTALTSAVKTQ